MIDRRYESGESFVMYSKEELEAAQRTDMVTFLESHEGFNFKSSGGWYIGIEHDSLKINPDRYTWHWYSRDLFGKGAIDWLCIALSTALLSRLSYIFPAHAYPECHY